MIGQVGSDETGAAGNQHVLLHPKVSVRVFAARKSPVPRDGFTADERLPKAWVPSCLRAPGTIMRAAVRSPGT
jgi:hypothetical protein